ncbi:putative CoA transferase [Escherichia coli]|uniref:Putative CoA transferase n=1 Tax=Escherichia coli TaxID=562 RepID=A0A484X868_ECOLX|nr:putative CoA transferase [Escherichia coli]
MGIMRSLGQSPRISDLAEQNKIIAYNYPQGVLTQTLRAAAAHQPGIISDIGIGHLSIHASKAAN